MWREQYRPCWSRLAERRRLKGWRSQLCTFLNRLCGHGRINVTGSARDGVTEFDDWDCTWLQGERPIADLDPLWRSFLRRSVWRCTVVATVAEATDGSSILGSREDGSRPDEDGVCGAA